MWYRYRTRVRMLFRTACSLLLAAVASTAAAQTPAAPPPASPPNLTGAWALNPALTQQPAEIGFSPDWARGGPGGEGRRISGGGGRGRRGGSGSGGAGAPTFARESADDSTRVQQLTGEARTPPAHITIVQKADAVSIADDQGHSRTFHTDGRLEELTLGTVALPTTSRWDAGSLVIVYEVETGPAVALHVHAVREPDTARSSASGSWTTDTKGTRCGSPTSRRTRTRARSCRRRGDGARLTGLAFRFCGIAPSSRRRSHGGASTGAACRIGAARPHHHRHGRRRARHAGGGLRPRPGEDQDVDRQHPRRRRVQDEAVPRRRNVRLVNVVTSKMSDGLCVSRYDASLVSEADVTVPYREGPRLAAGAAPARRRHGRRFGGRARVRASWTDSPSR